MLVQRLDLPDNFIFASQIFMHAVLQQILSTGVALDHSGKSHPLHSHTSAAQCTFLQELVRRIDARRCLEIGLAYGVSSLAVCEEIEAKKGATFISIDPFQSVHWNDIGLSNLERAGYSHFLEFHPRSSHEVLPELFCAGCQIDFAYVDTTKVFDMVLVDASFLIRMLKPGGVIVFDDCAWPGIKKLVRYLASWPHLKVLAVHGSAPSGWKRAMGSAFARFIPGRERIFRPEILRKDEDLGVAGTCVAFEKIGEDSRPWDWSLLPG